MNENETCFHCHEEMLSVEGVDSEDGRFCSDECLDRYEALKEEGVVQKVTQEMIDAAPVINYEVAMIPHVACDPCPSCGEVTELFGTAIKGMTTPTEPFVMRAIAGKRFVIRCVSCSTILQVEKPLIVKANAMPGMRQKKL